MLSSTFPRWPHDTIPSFIFDLAQAVSTENQVTILAPHSPQSKTSEHWHGVEVIRFRYFFSGVETLTGEGGIMMRIRANPFRILLIPFFLLSLWVHTLWLLHKRSYDIIHAHWLFPQGFIVYLISWGRTIPYLVTSHGSDISQLRSRIFRWMHGQTMNRAQRITAVSTDLAQSMKSVTRRDIDIIPMGIKEVFFQSPSDAGPLLDSGKTWLVCVGRLDRKKGFQDVIQTLPYLSEEIHLVIVGAGSDKQYLETLAYQYQVEHRIRWYGSAPSEDIAQIFHQSQLCIHPSYTEGWGLVVLEAMATGLPVIGNDLPILRQHLSGRGKVIDTSNHELLADRINQILKNDHDYRTYQQQGRTYAQQFRWSVIGQEFTHIYEAMVEK